MINEEVKGMQIGLINVEPGFLCVAYEVVLVLLACTWKSSGLKGEG